MTKNYILIDIFLGLLIFTVWLNIKEENKIQRWMKNLTEETRSSLIGLLIISSPLLFENLLNINNILSINKESIDSKPSTFLISLTSAITGILIREFIVDFKNNLERKEMIFWELFNNHKKLSDSIQAIEDSKGFPKDAVCRKWNSLIKEKWRKNSYKKYLGNLNPTYIFTPNYLSFEVISLIDRVYEDMNILIEHIEKDKVNLEYPLGTVKKILSDVYKILQEIDPLKTQELLDKK